MLCVKYSKYLEWCTLKLYLNSYVAEEWGAKNDPFKTHSLKCCSNHFVLYAGGQFFSDTIWAPLKVYLFKEHNCKKVKSSLDCQLNGN